MPINFEHLFAINDLWLYPPSGYQLEPIPVAGYNLLGEPIVQGYSTLTLTWDFMRQESLTALLAVYDPTTPKVKLTVIDQAVDVDKPIGDPGPSLISYWAMMREKVQDFGCTDAAENVPGSFAAVPAGVRPIRITGLPLLPQSSMLMGDES